jgi:hypothetical protein
VALRVPRIHRRRGVPSQIVGATAHLAPRPWSGFGVVLRARAPLRGGKYSWLWLEIERLPKPATSWMTRLRRCLVADDEIPVWRRPELCLQFVGPGCHIEAHDQPVALDERIAGNRRFDLVAGQNVKADIELIRPSPPAALSR